MIYNDAIEQVKAAADPEQSVIRLATVTAINPQGKAIIKFYGSNNASTKIFPQIEGYKPILNDVVVLFKQGDTYILFGKATSADIVNNYYLLKDSADELYALKNHNHDEVYAAKDHKHDELYAPKDHKHSALEVTAGGYTRGVEVAQVSGSTFALMYSGTASIDIGSSSKPFNNFHANYGNFTRYKGEWVDGSNNIASPSYKLTFSNQAVTPNTTQKISLGTSTYQLNNVYAKQFYQSGAAISTSDRNEKYNIQNLDQGHVEFFKKLRPVSFLFKNGESGRTHTGFIAQEVEAAANESGFATKDFAAVCIEENGRYGIRYEEIIAIQTKVIQELLGRVEALEKKGE